MDILKILQESSNELIQEDLDFFETELATGTQYDEVYIQQCKERMDRIRKWMAGVIASPDNERENTSAGVTGTKYNSEKGKKSVDSILVDFGHLVPNGSNAPQNLSPKEQVQLDLQEIRDRSEYKTAFKKYVKESQFIDEKFLEKNLSMFDSWELDAIVSVKPLSEAFLEKYFGAINHEKIARYQMFSESFFMKHFSQMNAEIVLKSGKNEWRKKENRSNQLDVFLRLKGVKL